MMGEDYQWAIHDPMLRQILRPFTPDEADYAAQPNPVYRSQYANESTGTADFKRFFQSEQLVGLIRHPRFVAIPKHNHNYIETMYVCAGQITHVINGKEVVLESGDFLMMNQHTSHEILPAGEGDIAVTFALHPRFFDDTYELAAKRNVLSDFIVDLLRQEVNCNQYLHYKTMRHLPVCHLFEMLLCNFFPHQDEDSRRVMEGEGALNKTLMFLVFLYLSKDLSDLSCDAPITFDQIMMSTVMNYIEHSYQTATLTELADIMNQSASALSRQIKLVSGSTFKELLQSKRFQRAVALLKETNLAVSDIALAVGYENSSYFYRRFREIYGISPKVYRENNRGN
jgi:AraC-like DNA-binding protein/mannose-6-phosphate isomerase-like protein (cupin superfamily)